MAMAQAPVSVPWSNTKYGPEGPWHAVSVQIGTPPQDVDLFPAISYSPNILSRAWCQQAQGKPQGVNCNTSSRYFYANGSSTADWTWYTRYGAGNSWVSPMYNDGSWNLITDYMSVPVKNGNALRSNVSLQLVTSGEIKSGPNLQYTEGYSLGTLGLGAPEQYLHPLDAGQNKSLPIGNLTANYFSQTQHRLPSASWGLHYGSPSAGIPPSLTYGGYDRSRVLGTPIALQFQGSIGSSLALGDISIGTAEGASPWNYTSGIKSGLLRLNTSSASPGPAQQLIQTAINPGPPYMMLPEATCDAIAAELPVSYDANRQIYFWNTATPQYRRIVAGANYLAFTFTQLSTPDVTIKVPFALLNLTQTGPSGTEAPYFPCFRHGQPNYTLGRAFTQAAFFGGNWVAHDINAVNPQPGTWFLAQAPGPGLAAEDVQPFAYTQRTISNASMSWLDSWRGHWTVYDAAGSTVTSPSASKSAPSSRSGLSPGAQAGIAVPVTLVGLALIGLALWFFVFRRRRATKAAAAAAAAHDHEAGPPQVFEKHGASTPRWELLEREEKPAQLDGTSRVVAEMEGEGKADGGSGRASEKEKRRKSRAAAKLDKPLPEIRYEMPA